MSALSASSFHRAAACAAFLCLSFLLSCWSDSFPTHSSAMTHDASWTEAVDESLNASPHHTVRIFTASLDVPYHETVRISDSDLQDWHALEQSIQLSAFQQFGSGKTGRIYNISVPAVPSVIIQVVRLRSGSLRRYGVTISEFIIPRGCKINPIPERVLLVYAQLVNTTFFQSLPQGYVLDSLVLSVLAYDATNLNRTQPSEPLNVSTTTLKPITIQFAGSSGIKCASFDGNSTNVIYTDVVQGACQVTHLGAFALVRNASVGALAPIAAPIAISPHLSTAHSNAWKIVVGSVIGGLAVLVLVSFLALGIANYRKKAKFARMEYHTDHGETLQTTSIGNSRVPAAGSTRTQSTIEREYTV